jgi:hypothetical protein
MCSSSKGNKRLSFDEVNGQIHILLHLASAQFTAETATSLILIAGILNPFLRSLDALKSCVGTNTHTKVVTSNKPPAALMMLESQITDPQSPRP